MNFSFQYVCSTQIKMYQESGFSGDIFLVLCTAGSLELPEASPPGPPPGLCPGPTGRLIAPPRQTATPGNEVRSLHIVLSAGYHFYLCPHDKFSPQL